MEVSRQLHSLAALQTGKEPPRYQLNRRPVRPHSWSGRCKGKLLTSVRNETLPSSSQPVAIPTELSRLSFVDVPFKCKSRAFIAKPMWFLRFYFSVVRIEVKHLQCHFFRSSSAGMSTLIKPFKADSYLNNTYVFSSYLTSNTMRPRTQDSSWCLGNGRCLFSDSYKKPKIIVTCLCHAAIVEAQKSVNTLRNNRGSGVYSVPFRAAGGRAVPSRTAPRSFQRQLRCKHGDDATVLLVNPLLDNMTWRDLMQQRWLAPFS
jgi:hypothetical protein